MAAQPIPVGYSTPSDQRRLPLHHCAICERNVFDQSSTADLVVPSISTPTNKYQPVCGCVAHLDCMMKFMNCCMQEQKRLKQAGVMSPQVWCPFPGCLRIFTGLARLPKRASNMNQRVGPPPPLTDKPESYHSFFQYWDKDGNGTLDMQEVYLALIVTFNIKDQRRQAEVIQWLNSTWGIFDKDRDTTISREEFCRPGVGLGASIFANLLNGRRQ